MSASNFEMVHQNIFVCSVYIHLCMEKGDESMDMEVGGGHMINVKRIFLDYITIYETVKDAGHSFNFSIGLNFSKCNS